MALGYEGWAKLDINGTEDLVLCTGASVPISRLRLESNSGYGGRLKTPVNEIAIGMPHTYDWDEYDGSLSFEVHPAIITNQLKPWVFDRQKAGTIKISSRKGNENFHTSCFWSSISLNTSSGSNVEGSIGFVAIDSGTYAVGGDYIGNKQGSNFLSDPGSLGIPNPLQVDNQFPFTNTGLIPYWQTRVKMDSVYVDFISWNLDFTQDVVKFFACEKNASPVEPKFLAVGPMSLVFSGEYMFVGTSPWAVPDFLNNLSVDIGPEVIKMKRGEKNSYRDDVVSGESLVPISVEYSVYELES